MVSLLYSDLNALCSFVVHFRPIVVFNNCVRGAPNVEKCSTNVRYLEAKHKKHRRCRKVCCRKQRYLLRVHVAIYNMAQIPYFFSNVCCISAGQGLIQPDEIGEIRFVKLLNVTRRILQKKQCYPGRRTQGQDWPRLSDPAVAGKWLGSNVN